MDKKCTNETRFYLIQDLDENVDENLKDLDGNLAWLTQKTEDPKTIKGTLLHSPLTIFICYSFQPPLEC